MDNLSKSSGPEQIIEIAIKRRWLLIVPFILSLGVGLCLAFILPKVYQSQTLILVQPQKVPADFVKPLVSSNIDERISTISQQIMSRTNLEKIIDQFRLFAGPKYKNMYLEDKIDNMRKRIQVQISSDRRKDTDAFSISFKGEDPERVMKITNALASFFIDENLKVREAQAIGTSDFLKDELDDMRKRLADLEETLKTYRTKNMGALPEQLDTNLRVLERLQEELNNKQVQLRDARQLQTSLETQLDEAKAAIKGPAGVVGDKKSAPSPENNVERLERLRQQLADLRTRYTDRYPDIVRLKKQIEDLEAGEQKTAAVESQGTTASNQTRNAKQTITKAGLAMERQLRDTLGESKALEYDIPKIVEKIKTYQDRVEKTPQVQQGLLSIQRDYKNIKDSYDSLLQRKLEAELAVNMEKKQKGEQFRVVDPAPIPTKPIEPNMKNLLLLSIAVGIGLGCGLAFLLEYMNRSYRSPEEIESDLGLTVAAMIPVIETPRTKWFKRFNWAFTVVALLVSLTLLAGFASLTLIGEKQTRGYVKTITSSIR